MKAAPINLITIVLLMILQNTNAQEFQVPKNYVLQSNSDYVNYTHDVINCINWLESVPLSHDTLKHKEVNAFLVKWITGTPDVSISINSKVIKLTDKNKDLMVAYLGGWTKFSIENPELKNNTIKCYTAGVESIIKIYKLGAGIKRDRDVESAIKAQNNGKLEEYVKKKIMN